MSSDPRRDLAVLRQLTERLSDGRPLEDALHEVTEAALALLPCDHASIRVLDASRSQLLAGARSGKGTEKGTLAIAKGEGVAGWVMEHGLPAHVKDAGQDPRFMVAVGQGFQIGSMLGEPLVASGKAIGVLSASSPETGAFSQEDELLARILANCSVPRIEMARLERLAATDDLTLAFNGKYLASRMQEEMDRSRHSGSPLSVLVVDLDRLARVNESYGRDLGDRVLSIFADRVRAIVRRYDVLVRQAGDDFVLILPATNPSQATSTAERLRKAMGEEPMEPRAGGFLTQTVSVGIATWDGRETVEELHRRAAFAMNEARQRGGNTVLRATPSGHVA